MADVDSSDGAGKGFSRPWEDEGAEIVPLPGIDDDDAAGEDEAPTAPEPAPGDGLSDDIDWEAMGRDDDEVDVFSSADYVSATTQEYQGLAEEVSRAAEEEWELQAVAATVPGVESGLVGFGDVSGAETLTEEEYEAIEQAATSDLAMRVASAVVVFGLFLGSLLLGGWWFSAFVILVMVVAAGEFYATIRASGYRPLALFGLIGVIMMGIAAANWGIAAIGGWAAAVVLLTILFFSLTQRRDALENASLTALGLSWAGMLAFAILIGHGPNPVAHIMFIVLLVALNDIGAYFAGRTFGRRKLAPVVSPKKTVEGWFGGLLVSAIAASVLSTFPAWDAIGLTNALITAGVVAVIGPIGDLSASAVKRSIGVKDMGSVLPGHGGLLDRIDSFLFSLPAVYFLFRAFELL